MEARHFDQVRRLSRSSEKNPSVSIQYASVEDVKAKLATTIQPDQVSRQLDGIMTDRLSVALFSSCVLLVEGSTEAAVFYGIGDRGVMGRLESQGLTIVSAGGKNGIPLIHAILSCLGIPTYVLFDGDSGFEARAREAGRKLNEISAERTKHSTENRNLLRYLGEYEVDFPSDQIGSHTATLSDRLESYLEANWPEWFQAFAALEKVAGIELGKNQYAYRTATISATGKIPELLHQILMKACGA